MRNRNDLVGNEENTNELYCFAEPGEVYLVYIADKGTASLDLNNARGAYSIKWFNPREGGGLQSGSVAKVKAGSQVSLGYPPKERSEDWLALVRRMD